MKKIHKFVPAKPDFNDLFSPDPDSIVPVCCFHCSDTYPENQIKWNEKGKIWVCKNYPYCDGAGFGWDIWPVTDCPEFL